MKIVNYLKLLIAFCFVSNNVNAQSQWDHSCNDTLTYHNHQDGELMVQTSTNKLYSLQKQVNSNLFRLDILENDQWNNVITGTDAVDFAVTDNEIYLLRKVANVFVIENYDLSASLNWSSTSTLAPMTAQFLNAEMLHGEGDTLFIHFTDPNATNGGSVYRFDGTNWTDLNPGNFKRVKLDNSNRPVGLNVTLTTNPVNANYTFKRYNQLTSSWDIIGTENDPHYHTHADFVVAENDTIYLASVTYEGYSHLQFSALFNGNSTVKDSMIFVVSEFVVSMNLIEDKEGNMLFYYSNSELGPWGWVMGKKWRYNLQSWISTPGFGTISNQYGSEYIPMDPVISDAVVDEYNTYFVAHSYKTDWAWADDSTHTHVRKYLNCLYLANVNEIDTLNGQLIAHAGPIYNFQWIDCEDNTPIPGATDSVFTIPGSGMYAVIISNGECSDTSDCFDLSELGFNESSSQQAFTIYPNPAQDILSITVKEPGFSLSITDGFGNTLLKKESITTHAQVFVAHLPSGVYFVRIGESVKCFFKQ